MKLLRRLAVALALACALPWAASPPAGATVSSIYTPAIYTGDGTTTAFAFSYQFFSASDLSVSLYDTSARAPVIPQPVLNGGAAYDYTVIGAQDASTGEYLSGATVTFNTAPPANYQVTIARVMPSIQPALLTNGGPFPAPSVMASLDRQALFGQQLQVGLAGLQSYVDTRALQIPANDPFGLVVTVPGAAARADKYLGFDGAGNVVALGPTAIYAPGGGVTNNASLAALPGTDGPSVCRYGFSAWGDSPVVCYTAVPGKCSLNGGLGDGGSQVPASDGQCWEANFQGMDPTPRIWGALGDGTTDDHAALQAALNALAGDTLYLGPYLYRTTVGLSIPADTTLVGMATGDNSGSGIRAGAPNLDLVTLDNNATLASVYLDAGAAGANTSGSAISAPTADFSRIEKVWVNAPCIGVDIGGLYDTLSHVVISQVAGSGCGGVRVGAATIDAQTIDALLDHIVVTANTGDVPDFGLLIEDAGGLWLRHSDLTQEKIGTKIDPGAGQSIVWLTADDSYLGDTTTAQPLLIDTSAASGLIRGLQFNTDWTSSGKLDGVLIQNTGGGQIQGVHFVGLRSYNNGDNGLTVDAGDDVTLDDSHLCGNSASSVSSGVIVGTNVSDFQMHASQASDNCDGFSSTEEFGLAFSGGNAAAIVVGNRLDGNVVPSTGTPTGASVVADNQGVDTQVTTIASAATVALASIAPTWDITGTTAITTITGFWSGRTVRLITTGGPIAFETGGNICDALTSAQNVPVDAYYNAGGACWYLK